MFDHILVPTDLTEKSLKALEIAVKIASQKVSRVTLLHVIETISDADDDELNNFYEKLKSRAQEKMRQITQDLNSDRLILESRLTLGKRVREIVRFVDEHGVDLVVLSSHKVDANHLSEGWGTISYKVGILANCPVMMVK